ncbi:hypothetical protein MRB53_016603 [Persea americana]|uniref:Uncharacterized protein n=1 Tax=Persea americana TaxID=3435 RepID=A0ACC2M2H5_PERAE|nr:hypothetical protein MRB53_016603 [Persea americana]
MLRLQQAWATIQESVNSQGIAGDDSCSFDQDALLSIQVPMMNLRQHFSWCEGKRTKVIQVSPTARSFGEDHLFLPAARSTGEDEGLKKREKRERLEKMGAPSYVSLFSVLNSTVSFISLLRFEMQGSF